MGRGWSLGCTPARSMWHTRPAVPPSGSAADAQSSQQPTYLRMQSIPSVIPMAAHAAGRATTWAEAAIWRAAAEPHAAARRAACRPLLLLMLLVLLPAACRCPACAPCAALGLLLRPRPEQRFHVVAQHVQQGLARGVKGRMPHLSIRRHCCTRAGGGGEPAEVMQQVWCVAADRLAATNPRWQRKQRPWRAANRHRQRPPTHWRCWWRRGWGAGRRVGPRPARTAGTSRRCAAGSPPPAARGRRPPCRAQRRTARPVSGSRLGDQAAGGRRLVCRKRSTLAAEAGQAGAGGRSVGMPSRRALGAHRARKEAA